MKPCLFSILVLSLSLLCACGPKAGSSTPSGSTSQSAQQPSHSGAASSSQPQPPPQASCATAWLAEYGAELASLGKPLNHLAAEYDLLSYDWWPDGREGVRIDMKPLLFSGPPRQADSVCAAIGTTIHLETSVDVLRSEWEDTLVFAPHDPVAGACWLGQAGEVTFRFLTDSQGRALRSGGSNLVLSRTDLLPPVGYPQWADGLISWIDQWTEQPAPVWDGLLSCAAALGQLEVPSGATQSADQTLAGQLYVGYGIKDPSTGVQYFSSEQGQPWEAISLPATLILEGALPANTDEIITRLNTAFSWSLYNEAGYWFYLGNYKVFLRSDEQGTVPKDSNFLIRWGDNAGT